MAEHIFDVSQDRKKRFSDAVSRQGYAFQNAILKCSEELFGEKKSGWTFEVSEFPVKVNDIGTRIDFVLWTYQTPYWILGECKRVNPALAEWYFARMSHVRWSNSEACYVEMAQEQADKSFTSTSVEIYYPEEILIGHVGFEVKTNQTGDKGGGSDAIEKAAGQILTGVNGMVEFLNKYRDALGVYRHRILIPVLFTTAKLWVSEQDLSIADLQTGKIDWKALNLKSVPYLFYQYHLSPGIKHAFGIAKKAVPVFNDSRLSGILAAEFIRSVIVVSASGVQEFFTKFNTSNFVRCALQ
jgi:hypothetical protein